MGIQLFFKQLYKPKNIIDIVLSTNMVALSRDFKPRIISKNHSEPKSVLFVLFSQQEILLSKRMTVLTTLLKRRASLAPNLIPMSKIKVVILAHMHDPAHEKF